MPMIGFFLAIWAVTRHLGRVDEFASWALTCLVRLLLKR
jgi:hypothetical protein